MARQPWWLATKISSGLLAKFSRLSARFQTARSRCGRLYLAAAHFRVASNTSACKNCFAGTSLKRSYSITSKRPATGPSGSSLRRLLGNRPGPEYASAVTNLGRLARRYSPRQRSRSRGQANLTVGCIASLEGAEVLLEHRHDDHVVAPAALINIASQHTFLPKAQHLPDKGRDLMVVQPHTGNSFQVEFVESVFQHQINRLAGIAVPPVGPLADYYSTPVRPAVAVIDRR